MIDHIFDYGSLSEDTESLYIKAMLRKQIGLYCSDEIEDEEVAAVSVATASSQEREASAEDIAALGSVLRRQNRTDDDNDDSEIEDDLFFADELGNEGEEVVGSRIVQGVNRPEHSHRGHFRCSTHGQCMENSRINPSFEGRRERCIHSSGHHGDSCTLCEVDMHRWDCCNGLFGSRCPGNDSAASSFSPEISPKRRAVKSVKSPYAAISPFDEFIDVFCKLTCAAQEKIRELYGGERSSASLRDVSRCVRVFLWFGRYFESVYGAQEGWSVLDFFSSGSNSKVQKYLRKSVFLSLAYCYYARLPRQEREDFLNHIVRAWKSLQESPASHISYGGGYSGGAFGGRNNPAGSATSFSYTGMYHPPNFYLPSRPRLSWLELNSPVAFLKVLHETQRQFVDVMNLGEGIALNEALCENLFMVLVSILNQIPIIVIGKPGSSKSLAMGLIQSNLKGKASDHPFLKTLPVVEVFSYQCSPLSTSSGIESAFDKARRYLRESTNTVVVILLDEVGLAEQSPHLPLKVLHKVLDESAEGESVVGISNWSLDPAKMNRAVHLYRPAPTVEDLSLTAEGMVRSANLKGYLHALARAYSTTYNEQEHPDFWGLREFYSTVRSINTALQQRRLQAERDGDEDHVMALDEKILLNAVLRNFGGRPHELSKIVNCFFANLGLLQKDSLDQISIEDLVVENICQSDARHLMLLTKNNAALSLLFDRGILQQDRTEVIFGSDFPLDQTDLQICLNIQRIKVCMAEGITVILVHCESLYESLYDLLNQHYTTWGGMKYVRLAFGTNTRQCPIHPSFRIICIVEKQEAYTKLAPPLLNRFEKQVFERKDVLREKHSQMMQHLESFARAFATGSLSRHSDVNLVSIRAAFCGYHTDLISSLLLATESQYFSLKHENAHDKTEKDACDNLNGDTVVEVNSEDIFESSGDDNKELIAMCISRLLWIATPEASCRLVASRKGNII
jgi:hypothetical protein